MLKHHDVRPLRRLLSHLLLVTSLLSLGACAAPMASLGDDASAAGSVGARAAELRRQVRTWEGRRVRGVDPNAIVRMRDWIARFESSETSETERNLYEEAVQAQLDVIKTSETRYGAVGDTPTGGQP